MSPAKNKIAVRIYLDQKSVNHLNEWAESGDRSVSQVVRDLIKEQAAADVERNTVAPQYVLRPAEQGGGKPWVTKPMDFEIDPELEKSLANSPVLVTHEMMEDFKRKTDRQKLPIVSFPGGDSKVPWSKIIPILELSLIDRNLSAFFYANENRFELVGGGLGAGLKWWQKRADQKRVDRQIRNMRHLNPEEALTSTKKKFLVQ